MENNHKTESSDITLIFKNTDNNENSLQIKVNKLFLLQSFSHFGKLFNDNFKEANPNEISIIVPNKLVMQNFIKSLYENKIK